MKQKLRDLASRIRHQTTPDQRVWMARAMFFTGCAMLWRAFQTVQPGTALAMVGLGVFTATAICYVNFLIRTPRWQGAIRWSVLLVFGGFLNYAVIIANGGYMPAANAVATVGMHMPMEGAALPWLADWIFGFVSPGDVLMFAGGIGIAATLARRRQRQVVEQA